MIKNTPAFDQNTPEINKKPACFQLFEERMTILIILIFTFI